MKMIWRALKAMGRMSRMMLRVVMTTRDDVGDDLDDAQDSRE